MKLWHKKNEEEGEDFLKYYHLGRLCPELFHEIKNKLIAPKIFLQTFPEKFQDLKFRNDFSKIAAREIDHIQKLILRVLDFRSSSLNDSSDFPHFSIALPKIVKQCLSILGVEIQKYGIRVQTHFLDSFSLPISTAQTREIVFNLLLNALQAMKNKRGKKVLSIFTQNNKNQIQLKVEDSGKGMTAEELRHVFQPYFTTKSGGSGLGLSTSKRWIEKAGGNISLKSLKNKGTTVTAAFPQ